MALNPDDAATFRDPTVANNYRHRPEYPESLLGRLTELTVRQRHALDLGCGPGKLAGPLAQRFDRVTAVDASPAMIAEGRSAYPSPNITWHECIAEEHDVEAPLDLVTIGAAVHWFDHAVVFPRLAAFDCVIAVIDGDGAQNPPWQEAWVALMQHWLARRGKQWDPQGFQSDQQSFEAWLDVGGREQFAHPVRQRVGDFIACQHSRATWSLAAMGEAEAARFDEDVAAVLEPHVDGGCVSYQVQTNLVWGTARATSASAEH